MRSEAEQERDRQRKFAAVHRKKELWVKDMAAIEMALTALGKRATRAQLTSNLEQEREFRVEQSVTSHPRHLPPWENLGQGTVRQGTNMLDLTLM